MHEKPFAQFSSERPLIDRCRGYSGPTNLSNADGGACAAVVQLRNLKVSSQSGAIVRRREQNASFWPSAAVGLNTRLGLRLEDVHRFTAGEHVHQLHDAFRACLRLDGGLNAPEHGIAVARIERGEEGLGRRVGC